VELLGGSGPLDRDETIGRNKPLKDVAWGLASRGIVVLRFDKVTNAHATDPGDVEHFTLDDEYLPHALQARARQAPPNTSRPSTSTRAWSTTSRAGYPAAIDRGQPG
jgi:hypothetical protein